MKIRMLSTAPGSVDGIRVVRYRADQEYDLGETEGALDLAAAFVASKLAVRAGEDQAASPVAPLTTIEAPADAPRAATARRNARTTK